MELNPLKKNAQKKQIRRLNCESCQQRQTSGDISLSAATSSWVTENENENPANVTYHTPNVTRGSTRLRTKERVTGPGYSRTLDDMGNVAAVQNGMDCCQAAEGVICDDDEEKKTQTRQRTETLQRKPSSLCGDVPWTDCMDDRRGESNRNRNRGSQNGPGLFPDGTRRPLAAVQGNSYGTQRHSNAYPTESWCLHVCVCRCFLARICL